MIQANTNNRWARLSQSEKAELLGIYASKGYHDLANIIAHYNSCGGKLHASGGPVTNTARYKDNSYIYNPPVNVGAPIETPYRFRPQPDLGDYNEPSSTGMMVDYPIVIPKEISVPDPGYGVSLTAEQLASMLDPKVDAAKRIMAVENSKANAKGGWDEKTGRWYPHQSVEGGADTIAYGIKLSNGTPEAAVALKQGYLTDEQATHFVDTLVQKHYNEARKHYNEVYGEGAWDKLSDKSQSILVDYSYNPGLSKFPKLMEAFHSGDKEGILREYKRYSDGKPLGRNDYLLEEINQLDDMYPILRAEGGKLFDDGGDTDDDGHTVRLPWWQRMIHGAAMAEAPAVMTAAGMQISPDGTITYGNDNEGVRRLRNNLAVIGAAGAAGAAFPGAINWLSNPANQIIAGKIAMPLLGGATTNEAVRQYTPWNGWGDMLVRGTGLDEVMDYALLPREQQDFAYAGAEMTNPLFYAPYGKFGELGASAIGKAERGVGRFTDSARKYVEGVKDRLAESVVRMADTVKDEPLAATRQIFSPNGLRYILDPKASHLAYELPYKYSGSDYLAGDAHAGDLVDQWIGKSPVEGGVYDYNRGIVPEGMMDAIKRLYPNKVDKIPLVQFETKPSEFFGDVPSYELGVRRSAMAGSVQDASGRSIVDPGRYGSYLRQAEDGSYYFDNWDLWKFHPESQRPNGLKRLFYKPAKFVDDRGTPILFNWKTPVKINAAPEAEASTDWYWSGMNRGDFDDYINFGILDKVPGDYYVDVPYNEPFLKNGGKIHIKPENRGKFTALKERTGHSASWFKAHGTPSQKKTATFALNARKWKHEDGGPLQQYADFSGLF